MSDEKLSIENLQRADGILMRRIKAAEERLNRLEKSMVEMYDRNYKLMDRIDRLESRVTVQEAYVE